MKSTLRSASGTVLVAKGWATILFGVAAVLLSSGKFPRTLILAAPFALFACFSASLAIVEVNRDGRFRYKRYLRWKPIQKDKIRDARLEWPPFIASIRFEHYVFPWGRLYFVLDENKELNPFREGRFVLLQYIQDVPASGNVCQKAEH